LSLCASVDFASDTKKHSEYGKMTEFFLNGLSHRARLPFKKGLGTESNLSSSVLKEIMWCLGIDYEPYRTREKFIDSRLLARRNHVAHGEGLDVDPDEYDGMRADVVGMMTYLKTELENSAVLRSYVKT